jgi:hypothetical protein
MGSQIAMEVPHFCLEDIQVKGRIGRIEEGVNKERFLSGADEEIRTPDQRFTNSFSLVYSILLLSIVSTNQCLVVYGKG